MFETETVLILVALATAVLGTLWDAKRWGKIAILALAVVSAGTAIWESQKKAAEAASNKRNIAWILRAVQPPEVFDDSVLNGFRSAAEELGLFVSGQTIAEDGARVFSFKKSDEDERLSGVVFVSAAARRQLFSTFVTHNENADQELNSEILDLVTGTWGTDDLNADWNEFAIHVFEIAKYALGDIAPTGTQFEATLDVDRKTIVVSVYLPDGRFADDVAFDMDFVKSLPTVSPIERGRLIYEKTLEQV